MSKIKDKDSIMKAREEIIAMQRWIAGLSHAEQKDPLVKELVSDLMRTRASLEKLM